MNLTDVNTIFSAAVGAVSLFKKIVAARAAIKERRNHKSRHENSMDSMKSEKERTPPLAN